MNLIQISDDFLKSKGLYKVEEVEFCFRKIVSALASNNLVEFRGQLAVFAKSCSKLKRSQTILGCQPILNYKYWNQALKANGVKSQTFMSHFFDINNASDFDLFWHEVTPPQAQKNPVLLRLFALRYILTEAELYIGSFREPTSLGLSFGFSEQKLLKDANIFTWIMPYGSDAYMYSHLTNKKAYYGLNASYPIRSERVNQVRISEWCEYADVIIAGTMRGDGIYRNDCYALSTLCLNVNEIKPSELRGSRVFKGSELRILHAINHTGFKGTEYVIHAVNSLKSKGRAISLHLVQGKKNSEVLEAIDNCDLVIDQLIWNGYGLFAVEAMSKGCPVIANLENLEDFSAFSFLDSCPIISSGVTKLCETLESIIVGSTDLASISQQSRHYAETYHSFDAFFGLYLQVRRFLQGQIDRRTLLNLFHPLQKELAELSSLKL